MKKKPQRHLFHCYLNCPTAPFSDGLSLRKHVIITALAAFGTQIFRFLPSASYHKTLFLQKHSTKTQQSAA
ncbi:hypothetical protein L4G92_05715 [Neisseria sp. ZJ106]|uniref:Uncharacterized protein n=1 Tax=Neisseria lisongii TaxID=2912188 RepID=A0ABY7RL83_9NEIS|nr:hypothetical protein [Neisseria lisongii]MCF7521543.1 hypothetical protein [Neisseria lisongii]WCL71030.1 hypothetical protein PJU73_06620 [Neisseria lisongii]